MPRVAIFVLALGYVTALAARADFNIDLKVETAGASASAQAEQIAIGVTPRPRKVLEAKAGTPVKVRWALTNASPKSAQKNIIVHFFAVKIDQVGQKLVPKLTKDVTAESALTMDFNPGEKAQGALTFTVDHPGPYLVRLETIGAPDDENYFAALDLLVK
jgi:hypothetical protein